MNNIFKIIWNRSTNQFVVVSELAKGKIKAKSEKNGNKKSPLLSIGIVALSTVLALPSFAAATNQAGNGNGIAIGTGSYAPDTESVAIGSNAKVKNYADQTGSIAIGSGSFVENINGRQEKLLSFNQTKFISGIAIGQNTYARTGSIMLGTQNYTGKIGDADVNSSDTAKYNKILGADID